MSSRLLSKKGNEPSLELEERCKGRTGSWGDGLLGGEGTESQGLQAPWKLSKK